MDGVNMMADYVAITYVPKDVGCDIKNIYDSRFNENITMKDDKIVGYFTEQIDSWGETVKVEKNYLYNDEGLLIEINFTKNKKNAKTIMTYDFYE